MAVTGEIAEAFVAIKANTKQYEQSMKGVKSSLGSIAKVGLAVGGVLATALIVKGISTAIKDFREEEEAIATLGAVLKTTGNAAGFSKKEMVAYASELQNITTVSNTVILSTQAILATFKNINGDKFKEATVAALDMAAVMKTDAKAGAIQLGKALNNPTKGITALTRVGVEFTKAQIEQIKAMDAAGDKAGAQAVILKELKGEFGGAAAAIRNTFSGAITGAQNDLSDFGKAVVGAFAGGDATKSINNFSGMMQKITDKIKKFSESGKMAIFLANLKQSAKRIWIILKTPFVAFGRYLGTVIHNWVAIFKFLGNMIKNAFAGNFGEIKNDFKKLGDSLQNPIKSAFSAIIDANKELEKNQKDRIKAVHDAAVSAANRSIDKSEEESDTKVSGEKKVQKEIKKTLGIGTAESIREQMQRLVLVRKGGVSPIQSTTGSPSPITSVLSKGVASGVLKQILDATLISNQILTSIRNGGTTPVVTV